MRKNKGKNKGSKSNGTTGPVIDDEGFELLGGGRGKEMALGEVVVGIYGGVVRSMKGQRKGTTVPFYQVGDRALLGSTILRSRIEEATKAKKLREGDILKVTRIEDIKAKPGQSPAKNYEVRVKRADA